MTDNLAGNNIYNNTPYGNLGYDNTANVYNTMLEPVNENAVTNNVAINVLNTNAEFIISSVSITKYISQQNIINSVVDVNIYGLKAVYNKNFINTTRKVIFNKDSLIDDGATSKNTIKADSIEIVDNKLELTANIVVEPGYKVIEVNNNITLSSPSVLHMSDNMINRSSDNIDSMISIANVNGYIDLKNGSKLEIVENSVDITTNEKAAAVLYLTSNQTIKLSTSSIIITDKKAYGSEGDNKKNHVNGIYSDNTNGFIEQVDGKILAKESEIDSIAFSSDKGYGTVYKNWTKDNVSEWTSSIYKSVFKADTTLHEELLTQMDGKDVVINKAHTHKECGITTTSVCAHTGIASHIEAIQYDSFTKEDEFPTEGAIYLTEEIENVGSIALTNDLYIYLNGFNLKGIKFIGGEDIE